MKKLLMALTIFCTLALPFAVHAQQPPSGDAAKQWETVSGGAMMQPGESIPASTLVAIAYGFIWVMVMGFVASVWQRTGRVDNELKDLRRRIAEAARDTHGKGAA